MLEVFDGQGHPRADTAPHHVPGRGSTRHGPHRHRGTVPGILGRLAVRRHVCGQRFTLSAPIRDTDKSTSAILGVVQRFAADMGVPRAFRTDNGTEYTNSAFVEYCNSLHIRRELTVPYTPQQNGPVESGLSRAIKAGRAARIEVNRLFPDVRVEQLKGVRDPDGTSLWMEYVLWASEGFTCSATTANGGKLSPYEIFYGSRPLMPTLPFCKPAYHRIPRQGKLDRQARLCYFLNFGYNHGSHCVKIMDAETGRIVHSRDVTWHQPLEPLISPAPTVESEGPQSPSGAATPEYIYIQPAPTATTAPAAASVPASDNAAPAPPRNPTEPIRDRIVREPGHGDVRMPGRTQGEMRAMRESPRSMGLMGRTQSEMRAMRESPRSMGLMGRTQGEMRAMRESPRSMGLVSHAALAQG